MANYFNIWYFEVIVISRTRLKSISIINDSR